LRSPSLRRDGVHYYYINHIIPPQQQVKKET